MERKIICRVLTGPTASGKSALALRLAREMGWALLCMDSMQIYRGMDIGTAKPTAAERSSVPHYLLDLCDPGEAYSAAMYREAAEAKIAELDSRGQGFLFVGGTGLYLQTMVHRMQLGSVQANPVRRQELQALAAAEEGRRKLHAMLEKLDPVAAARLPAGDVRRIIRAIEVTETTGIPFSAHQEREDESSPYTWRIVSTALPRPELYRRIHDRVPVMMRQGLREEVAGLLAAGVPETAQSMQGIGYKEVIPLVRGECTEEETIGAIQLATRHYAKRQMTFLRRESRVQYVDVTRPEALDTIRDFLMKPDI